MLYRVTWFYPARMIVVGAHYLPFVHLYGMRQFWVLGALMAAAGVAFALYLPGPFSLGAWVTAVLLMVFAFLGRAAVTSEPEPRIVKEPA
jgi:hypothetical protein